MRFGVELGHRVQLLNGPMTVLQALLTVSENGPRGYSDAIAVFVEPGEEPPLHPVTGAHPVERRETVTVIFQISTGDGASDDLTGEEPLVFLHPLSEVWPHMVLPGLVRVVAGIEHPASVNRDVLLMRHEEPPWLRGRTLPAR